MNFYLGEYKNIDGKNRHTKVLQLNLATCYTKNILAKQCKIFLMIVYFNDSCSFKMSIQNTINYPFNSCFVYYMYGLFVLLGLLLTHSYFHSQLILFSNFMSKICIEHCEVCNTGQKFHKTKYKVELLSSRKLK